MQKKCKIPIFKSPRVPFYKFYNKVSFIIKAVYILVCKIDSKSFIIYNK